MDNNELYKPICSSFLTVDKDIEQILKLLFIESRPYSDILKRLLIINSPDCLDMKNQDYQKVIDSYSLSDLIEKKYIRLNPKIARGTHEEIKSYLIIALDSFSTNSKNPAYRDYNIFFDVVCYNDAWVLEDYKIRPLSICGYIDGILNSISNPRSTGYNNFNSQFKLSGIGEYEFLGCQQHLLNEDLGMYTLAYHGTHFSEDIGKMVLSS